MEMAEFTEGMSRDRARQIIKGKRTKRQRPNSPLATSATSGDCLIDNFNKSPVMSTKEDEDMANCLIMLARSVYPVTEEEYSDIQIRQKTAEKLKLTSVVKSGFYVYECKTCNRTFPSFQALGGHRASHKKPKVNNNNNNNNNIIIIPPPLIEFVEEDNNNSNSNKLDLDQQKTVTEDDENKASINITNNINSSNSKGKVHECSICGSEFLSGQALGGHMRKHRPIPPPSGNRTGISTTSDEKSSTSSCMLSLDLNFPPPEVVDEHHQSPFQFTSGGSSQPHLMFTAPPFVDCHY